MLAKSYEKAVALIAAFAGKNVLVVGDLMLDISYRGTRGRPNPESGAPILKLGEGSRKITTGGAGNAARNFAKLGVHTKLVAVAGSNPNGWELMALPGLEGYAFHGVEIPEWITTTKIRYINQWGHHELRVDEDPVGPLPPDVEKRLIDECTVLAASADAIFVSDYAKGVVSSRLVEALKALAKKYTIPVFADVKPQNAHLFVGVDMLSPNQEEARAFLGRSSGVEPLEWVAEEVSKKFATTLFLTAAEQGIYVSSHGSKALLIPQRHKIEVADTSGCGDTAAVVILLSMLCGASPSEAAELANAAGAVVATHIGAVAPSPQEVLAMLAS